MNRNGILSSTEEISVANENVYRSSFSELDFVNLFPAELSEKLLFRFLSPKDLMSCASTCIAWRFITNSNVYWHRLCKKYGYLDVGESDPSKWTSTESHVDKLTSFRFRTSPRFQKAPIASSRLGLLCEWGLYFRQCHRLQTNWTLGRYITHKLKTSIDFGICNSADSNGNVAVLGSSVGSVFIWSVTGIPKLIHIIPAIRYRVEIEKVKLTSDFLIVLYQIGVLRIYKIDYEKIKANIPLVIPLALIAQVRVIGIPTELDFEFTLNASDDINDELFTQIDFENSESDGDDVEEWIREIFREQPWFESEYHTSDMVLNATNQYLVLGGLSCNCCLIWELETGQLISTIQYPLGFQLCFRLYLTEDEVYLSARNLLVDVQEESPFFILVYPFINEPASNGTESEEQPEQQPLQIRTESLVEEIQVEPNNNTVMVWTTSESGIYIRKAEPFQQMRIIKVTSSSYVDNLLLHGELILFHEYDGFIVALNWEGERLYQTSAHIGLIRGLQCYNEFLVSGGDVRQICVWNLRTGKKLHEVYRQPCRISYLFVHETKIITFGTEDSPVVTGYW